MARYVGAVLFLVALGNHHLLAQQAAPAALADGPQARMPIVIAEHSSERIRDLARTLADYLGKMSGARFAIETGDGKSGIALGLVESFPSLKLEPLSGKNDPTRREDYLLRSHAKGLHLIGASELAVQHAVWDLLHRLGHRQFFPGKTWEVIPKLDKVSIVVDLRAHPDFLSRSIWYGYGLWGYNAEPYRDWCIRNRMAKGIELSTGHAYDGILSRNAAVFKQHPEYLALLGGVRKGSKFCVSNPELRRLIIEDALKQMQANPDRQSLSMEPSDGVGWCECANCKAMGSPSDRALTLANLVAEALDEKYGDKFVGMYAYSQHSPPPALKVHPRVIVSVATAFVRGGYTTDQLLAGWSKQGATLGIREYYSVNTWDRDLPGAARAARLDYIKNTIPDFHRKGARFFSAESSDNWGPNGLGYYVASHLLWDVGQAKNVDALVADFLDKAFGSAQGTMKEFYRLLDGGNRPLLSDDLLGRMYHLLDEAGKKTADVAIHGRLHDLILYTRYVELYSDYANQSGEARQQAFEKLIKHTYRMRGTMMVHAKALYRDLDNRDKSVSIPKEAVWSVPEPKNPWKNSTPFSTDEIAAIVKEGVTRRKLLDFTPVSFSDELVPARALKLPAVKPGTFGNYYRGTTTFFTWLDKDNAEIPVKARAGIVYRDKGPAKLDLFPALEPEGRAVDHQKVPPDQVDHEVTLKTSIPGLQRLQIADASAGTRLEFPGDIPLSVQSDPTTPFKFIGRWSLYFYVPKGTKVVGGFAGGAGILRDGAGKEVHKFDKKPGYFSVPVAPGQDGKLWKFENSVGARYLMTVPPYLARTGQELLLPKEVVAKDLK